MMTELVTYTSNNHVATITINRAERMNALNEEVILGLQAAWQRLETSDDRVAVLTAAGDKAFSVGADVKDAPKEMWQGVPSIGAQTSKPVIAAVKGWCIGGSYVIVQMCDLVVAAENTTFKYPEAQLGFTGGLIASAVSMATRSSPDSSRCQAACSPRMTSSFSAFMRSARLMVMVAMWLLEL